MRASKKRSPGKDKPLKSIKSKPADSPRNETGFPWDDVKQKQKAYLFIMRQILADSDLGRKYLESDADAAQAFRDAGMDVPPDVKVVFVRAGDTSKLGTGSAVIELPPTNRALAPSDSDLLELFLCTYTLQW